MTFIGLIAVKLWNVSHTICLTLQPNSEAQWLSLLPERMSLHPSSLTLKQNTDFWESLVLLLRSK